MSVEKKEVEIAAAMRWLQQCVFNLHQANRAIVGKPGLVPIQSLVREVEIKVHELIIELDEMQPRQSMPVSMLHHYAAMFKNASGN